MRPPPNCVIELAGAAEREPRCDASDGGDVDHDNAFRTTATSSRARQPDAEVIRHEDADGFAALDQRRHDVGKEHLAGARFRHEFGHRVRECVEHRPTERPDVHRDELVSAERLSRRRRFEAQLTGALDDGAFADRDERARRIDVDERP